SSRRAPYSSVSTTTVIREMPSRSVWPTVNDSMLYARRRKSEATRFRTPGLLSTYTAKVCTICNFSIGGSFDDWRRPADHRVEIRTGWNHRVTGIFLFHREDEPR